MIERTTRSEVDVDHKATVAEMHPKTAQVRLQKVVMPRLANAGMSPTSRVLKSLHASWSL
jgi:hypothetical protein